MKKTLILLSFLTILLSLPAAAQMLTLVNNNTCSATITFNVCAFDGSSSCPIQTASITLTNGNTFGPENIYDFDALGLGPQYWNSGGSIGAGAAWGLSQTSWVGVAGNSVGSVNFTCFSVSQTSSIVGPGCTVYLTWSETPAGHVTITAN